MTEFYSFKDHQYAQVECRNWYESEERYGASWEIELLEDFMTIWDEERGAYIVDDLNEVCKRVYSYRFRLGDYHAIPLDPTETFYYAKF